MKARHAAAATVVLATLTCACAEEQPVAQPLQASPSSPSDIAPRERTPIETPTQAPNSVAVAVTDGQSAAILDTADSAEIEQAMLALHRAHDTRVRAFAQMMLDHHTQAKKARVAMVNITPEATDASAKLRDETSDVLAMLADVRGTEFDRAYMDLQVKEHQEVLETLDEKLLPAAHDADFKSSLVALRPVVVDHLARARDLARSLSPLHG